MILQIVTMSLFCFGAFAALDGLLYSFLGIDRIDLYNKLNDKVKLLVKPIIGCITCASTFWGNIAYFALFDFDLATWLISWVCCAGLNWFISNHYDI